MSKFDRTSTLASQPTVSADDEWSETCNHPPISHYVAPSVDQLKQQAPSASAQVPSTSGQAPSFSAQAYPTSTLREQADAWDEVGSVHAALVQHQQAQQTKQSQQPAQARAKQDQTQAEVAAQAQRDAQLRASLNQLSQLASLDLPAKQQLAKDLAVGLGLPVFGAEGGANLPYSPTQAESLQKLLLAAVGLYEFKASAPVAAEDEWTEQACGCGGHDHGHEHTHKQDVHGTGCSHQHAHQHAHQHSHQHQHSHTCGCKHH